MKKILYILVVFQCFIANSLNCQKIDNYILNASEPTIGSFNKFIDHPVSLFNGSVDVNLPIYNIKDGIIDIPINLRYNTSGITVAEEASWVGLGWNLDVGGYIQQSVLGTVDNSTTFNNDYTLLGAPTVAHCYGRKSTYEEMVETYGYVAISDASRNELQPDIYTYNFFGHSGKFYYDYRDVTPTIHLLKDDKTIRIEIQNNSNGTITWRIIDNNGTQYFFKTRAVVQNESGKILSFTYYLDKVVYSNGQIVSLTYNLLTNQGRTQNKCNSSYHGVSNELYNRAHLNNNTGSYSTYDIFELQKISTNNVIVEFLPSSRTDINAGNKLERIRISDGSNNFVKSFKFNYDYFISPVEGNYWQESNFNLTTAMQRLKLSSFYDESLSNKYEFTYTSTLLPIKTSYAVDFWDYYNGQISNTTLMPRLWDNINYRNIADIVNVARTGANRAFNELTADACMLTSIKYPTGGKTSFVYEPHTFSPFFLPTIQDQVIDKTYTNTPTGFAIDHNYETSTSFQFELTTQSDVKIDESYGKGLNTWQDMIGSNVILYNITNGVSIIFNDILNTIPSGNPDFVTFNVSKNLPVGKYVIVANLNNALGNNYDTWTKHGYAECFVYVPPQPDPNIIAPKYSKGGGMRIKKIYNIESLSSVYNSQITYYDYDDKSTANSWGKLQSNFDPCQWYFDVRYLVGGCDFTECNANFVSQSEFEISSDISKPLAFSNVGGNVGYSTVREHRENMGAEFTGKTSNPLGYSEYNYFNSTAESCGHVPVIPESTNGLLISKIEYDKNNKMVYSLFNNYNVEFLPMYYGINTIEYYDRHTDFFPGIPVDYEYPPCCMIHGPIDAGSLININMSYPERFTILYNPIQPVKIQKKYEITYKDGIQDTTFYKYNNLGQLNEVSTRNSLSLKKTINYNYIGDYTGSNTDFNAMRNQNIVSPVLNKTTTNNGNTVNIKSNAFQKIGSIPSPYFSDNINFYGIKRDSIAQDGVNFLTKNKYKFDGSFFPNEAQENNNVINSIIYGFGGTYPVVKGVNISYDALKIALNATTSSLGSGLDAYLLSVGSLTTDIQKNNWRTFNNLLRNNASANAQITTYSYLPNIGLTSQTDANGITVYYEYDSNCRLKCIRNDDGNILKTYDYHFVQ